MNAPMTAFRLASWRRPLRTEPSRVAGRFHRVTEDVPTQYLCLHPLGPWAEFLRASGLGTAEQLALVRHRTWALRLDLAGLVRIGFADAAEHGLRPGDLVSDDHRACHRLADRLRAAGRSGSDRAERGAAGNRERRAVRRARGGAVPARAAQPRRRAGVADGRRRPPAARGSSTASAAAARRTRRSRRGARASRSASPSRAGRCERRRRMSPDAPMGSTRRHSSRPCGCPHPPRRGFPLAAGDAGSAGLG